MMKTYVSLCIFFAGIQVISTQQGECAKAPQGINPFDCCPLPRLHDKNEFQACDFGRKDMLSECKQKTCLLRNRGLLYVDDTINLAKMKAFIDAWASNSPHIKKAVQYSKELCFNMADGAPASTCPADRLYNCVINSLIWNCELKIDGPRCKEMKSHIDKCKPFK